MSNPGQQPNMQEEAAAALSGQRPQGAMPQSPGNGAAPPQQGPQGGSLASLAQAYARCEQTHQCMPQDRQILQQGLPNLIQMVKNIQAILQTPELPERPGAGAPPQNG